METLQKEFFDWLCDTFGFTAAVDAFQHTLPTTNQTGDAPVMWLVENTAFVTQQFATSTKMKEYSFLINYRATKARDAELKVLEMEQVINHLKCFNLPSYKVIWVQANSFGADRDPDAEKFTRGSVTVTFRILDNYEYEPKESS